MTARSWKGWIDRYQVAGYIVLAPNWPRLEGEVEVIRRDPSPLEGLTIKTVVDHYEKIIRQLERPLTDGIQLSDDPFAPLRSAVYALSVAHR